MKRIGIVTIYDSKGNIGNKLQNYAVIKVFNASVQHWQRSEKFQSNKF